MIMIPRVVRALSIFLILSILPSLSIAQGSVLKGRIVSAEKHPIAHVDVFFKGTNFATVSGNDGMFTITSPAGSYAVVASALGYASVEMPVDMAAGDKQFIEIQLDHSSIQVENVVVRAKSAVRQINESSFNVVAIDAHALHNTTQDLAGVLDRVSGIKIRGTGGLGSGNQISLNGFSGRHVKVFMDGVPMDGGGSSFQINNIPVSLADRIEVYKGVVPIELGADALGGAINIVTRNTANTYLDASYSYGSFNTHRSSLSIGHTTRRGFTVQFNGFQNYSDNSYRVKTQLLDLETNTYSQNDQWFKRFHDMYRNEAVVAKFGVTGKRWANRLLFGITYSREKDQIQNANLMKVVFGGKIRTSRSVSPSFNYEIRDIGVRNLDLSVSANYNMVRSRNTDTLARQYNWLGQYRNKSSKGEGTYSLSESDNNSLYVTANLRYRVAGKHFITLNNVFSGFTRKATDAAANYENSTETTFMRRRSNKNVLGLSYKFSPGERFNISAFAKHYELAVTGPVDVSTGSSSAYEERRKAYSATGYGFGGTYILPSGLQFKISYEQAYRLPTERELFGDEVLETGDVALKPENSRNVNFNLNYNAEFGYGHAVYAEAGLIFRHTTDYIRRQIEQRYGGAYYTNHGKVRNLGADFEARYFFRDRLAVGGNATWQNIRNRERYSPTGQQLIYYNDRMPNVPYFFSNADATYNFHNMPGRRTVLSLTYNLSYVHEFFRNWESEGSDIIIPRQLSHDVTVTCSFGGGQYNIAFEVLNFTDEILYDNYSLQRPGRCFNVKMRYFFFKVADPPQARTAREGSSHGREGRDRRGRHHNHRPVNIY